VTGRILIAGVGYRNLRDMSLGPVLTDRLAQDAWPVDVEIEDLSYGPIAVMHKLDACSPYDRIIFIAGVCRDRRPGGVYCYPWEHHQAAPEEVQARVTEALTGVISLDNLLVIIEVEAVDDSWGEGFTPQVESVVPAVIALIRAYTTGD
jgi:hydrogenase maturation protease